MTKTCMRAGVLYFWTGHGWWTTGLHNGVRYMLARRGWKALGRRKR